ncbi:MAG: phosphate transport system permease protein [Gaiellaceae bacterium]|nr:phosphate transport system permease protein [Gaiellaceae bacterium]
MVLGRRPVRERVGDWILHGLTGAAAFGSLVLVGLLVYELVKQAWPAIDRYGLGFVTSRAWDPVKTNFGALDFIYGTAITSLVAIVIAAPLALAIALFLSELAPRGVRGVIGALVEMLAAIPSVVIGLWGIFVLAPVLKDPIQPFLHHWLGWIPLFSGEPSATGLGYFTAAVVLTIMVLPITASIARELFLNVPGDLKEAALALGMTRWEMIRGVVLPYTKGGLIAAIILGLSRAIGEAIAVTQVIGGTLGIHVSLFANGDTLASRIASQYQGAATNIQVAALVYLALILLVISLVTNFGAQLIVRRFEFQRTGGD